MIHYLCEDGQLGRAKEMPVDRGAIPIDANTYKELLAALADGKVLTVEDGAPVIAGKLYTTEGHEVTRKCKGSPVIRNPPPTELMEPRYDAESREWRESAPSGKIRLAAKEDHRFRCQIDKNDALAAIVYHSPSGPIQARPDDLPILRRASSRVGDQRWILADNTVALLSPKELHAAAAFGDAEQDRIMEQYIGALETLDSAPQPEPIEDEE